ncbi:MAG: type II toxin-antitoxin system PemK/MazF family toxin [Fibromonadales bacterium]|nr:type II toxin-antitoxin system PemK/MazF family toxin [Fibromonadales bacterium]
METSLFIETEISKDVEQIAKRQDLSVETVYIIAIKEFVKNHKNDNILNSLNNVYSETNSKLDKDIEYAQSTVLTAEWQVIKGEIWWANLPAPRGSEPAKRRPVLIDASKICYFSNRLQFETNF